MREQKRENNIFAELFQDPTTRQQRERHKQEVYKQNNKFTCLTAFALSLLFPQVAQAHSESPEQHYPT